MSKKTSTHTPKLANILKTLGENIHLARRRRKISSAMLAERACMTRVTLRAIEMGAATVSLGAYANVLFCLGFENELASIARDDEFGRKLQDAELLHG